ncbi:MAG: serine protease Do [Clostridia bacterium]|nr:serine protease Do [Clostridia bacterium]MDN5322603.1 serine protease Do [Clostridia bacterium]
MSYFDYEEYGKRPSKLSYFMVALMAAIIGGVLALYLAPTILGTNYWDTNPPGLNQPNLPNIPKGDLDVSPVVAIAEQVGPTVVGVSNRGRVQDFFGRTTIEERGSGSGVIIDSRGYIVTNYHVIEGASEVIVSLADGRKIEAEIVGSDPRTDLAVLKINAKNLPVAILGDSTKIRTGELVVAIGNPLGIEFARSVTVGVVSAKDRTLTIGDRQFKLIQTDAAINPGNSGGALVNGQGHVIGINSAKLVIKGVEGMGFAIPISDAKPIIDELIKKGYVSRPYLGIAGTVIDEIDANRWNVPQGILIRQLVVRGPAHKAGLKEMDIITAVDGQKVKDFNDLTNILEKHKPGDKVTLTIDRNGKKLDVPLVLGEMPRD